MALLLNRLLSAFTSQCPSHSCAGQSRSRARGHWQSGREQCQRLDHSPLPWMHSRHSAPHCRHPRRAHPRQSCSSPAPMPWHSGTMVCPINRHSSRDSPELLVACICQSMISFSVSSARGVRRHIGSVIGTRTIPTVSKDSDSIRLLQLSSPVLSHSKVLMWSVNWRLK